MARRVFISYQHDDQMKAKGFNLLRWNKNVNLEIVGRHLLDPLNSNNERYISDKIAELIKGSSVTVVLIGNKTCDSDWVKLEVQKSLEKENPNGILGIRLEPGIPIPSDSPVGGILKDAGAEIIDWNAAEFEDAIERAAIAAGRAKAIINTQAGGPSCSR